MKTVKQFFPNRVLWGMFLGFLCLSCRQKAEEVTDACVLRPKQAMETDASVLTDSITYIPLETSDESLPGNVVSAKRDGGCYFVQ